MNSRRKLKFSTLQDVRAEVEHLHLAGAEQVGQWSLPRICWHLARTIDMTSKGASTFSATPEQITRKKGFIDLILQQGTPPAGLEAPAPLVPPPTVETGVIEEFLSKLTMLENLTTPYVDTAPFGTVPVEEIRKMHMIHSAHHLSFLIPLDK